MNKKQKKQLLCKYSLPVFPVMRKWNERNRSGGGKNGDGLRCEGGGGWLAINKVDTASPPPFVF